MRKVIDLRNKPKSLKGEDVGDLTLGQLCAEVVIGMGTHSQHIIKLYTIAQELYTKGVVKLDVEDVQILRTAIESCDRVVLFAKAQLMLAVDDAKSE